MFLKHSNFFKDRNYNNSLTIIGEGIDFSGEVNTEGNIHLDGLMRGNIKAQEVVIGPMGDFDGEITADILIVNGNIRGKFNIKSLQVRKNGVLHGKIKYDVIIVEAGGRVLGELGVNRQSKHLNPKNSNKEKISSKDKLQV
ncbi:polymer-forming cytoskeletal protein [Alphaproteobacteria bacterium]|nr:polymer-forming cytoskeletal protein [Alphaproteobacteria bacterium]